MLKLVLTGIETFEGSFILKLKIIIYLKLITKNTKDVV